MSNLKIKFKSILLNSYGNVIYGLDVSLLDKISSFITKFFWGF